MVVAVNFEFTMDRFSFGFGLIAAVLQAIAYIQVIDSHVFLNSNICNCANQAIFKLYILPGNAYTIR